MIISSYSLAGKLIVMTNVNAKEVTKAEIENVLNSHQQGFYEVIVIGVGNSQATWSLG